MYTHYIMTDCLPTSARCCCFLSRGLSLTCGFFLAAAVYSARNEGKAHCFDLIKERFGEDCNYVAIGELPVSCSSKAPSEHCGRLSLVLGCLAHMAAGPRHMRTVVLRKRSSPCTATHFVIQSSNCWSWHEHIHSSNDTPALLSH